MAVEDHSQYLKWRKALEDLIEAQKQHKDAEKIGPAAAAAAMQGLQKALTAYHAVAFEILDEKTLPIE